ncbi:MAG: DUF2520 domain-containing protein [Planctomycetes bacterium]|nr:DUF2520 domain-containing protein [Planctomycetota bacterium]
MGPRIAILGAGAVGEALARALRGRDVALWSRSAERARAAARRSGARAVPDLARAVDEAELVLVCARDSALAELVARVARLELAPRARVVLHTSGAQSARVLAALGARGFGYGALHPLVPVPPDAPAGVFEGAGFAVEAPHRSVRAVAAALARELGGEPFELPTERAAQTKGRAPRRGAGRSAAARSAGSAHVPTAASERARYHAAATLVSNGSLALVSLALRELLPARLVRAEDRIAARAFATLLERTAKNLRALPPERALTGPVARGDRATLLAHLAVLPRTSAAGRAYRALSTELARLARADGRIEARTARTIERALR